MTTRLVEPSTGILYQEPGKSLLLSAYHGKTDIITSFCVEDNKQYALLEKAQAMKLIHEQFNRLTWRLAELLQKMGRADNFYFTELVQIKMPSWSKGRVALVGDAAYCASPAAGRGGSLAIDGAAALKRHGEDYQKAFVSYEAAFRPFVGNVQRDAVDFCEHFLGRTTP